MIQHVSRADTVQGQGFRVLGFGLQVFKIPGFRASGFRS